MRRFPSLFSQVPIAILEITAATTLALAFGVNTCSPFSYLVAMVFLWGSSWVLHRIHLPRPWKLRHDLFRNARVLASKR